MTKEEGNFLGLDLDLRPDGGVLPPAVDEENVIPIAQRYEYATITGLAEAQDRLLEAVRVDGEGIARLTDSVTGVTTSLLAAGVKDKKISPVSFGLDEGGLLVPVPQGGFELVLFLGHDSQDYE